VLVVKLFGWNVFLMFSNSSLFEHICLADYRSDVMFNSIFVIFSLMDFDLMNYTKIQIFSIA